MVLNSTSKTGDLNSSRTPLIVNTSSFNSEDFSNYISISEEIERLRRSHPRQRHHQYANSLPRRATATREEIFECSIVDDDAFLSALEHQNSHDAAITSSPQTQETILDMTEDFENLMKYFDEDVDVAARSNMNTPTELIAPGKVAAVLASFAQKIESKGNTNKNKPRSPKKSPRTSPKKFTARDALQKWKSSRIERPITPIKAPQETKAIAPEPNITELKHKYEPMKLKMTTIKDMQQWKLSSPDALLKPALLKGLSSPSKRRVLASPATPATVVKKKTGSPKPRRQSKVKEMAQMFNDKITEIVHRNDIKQYVNLHNQFSPEVKQQLHPVELPPRAGDLAKKQPSALPKLKPPPLPPKPVTRNKLDTADMANGRKSPVTSLKRSKLPIYRSKWSPTSSPRLRRRAEVQRTPSDKCLVAADVFGKLSVKDKALLYTKFIEDMTAKHPQFEKHVELLQETVRKQLAHGEVVTEKQETVKHLKDDFEAKCVFPKLRVSPLALQRIKSANDALLLKTPTQAPTTPLNSKAKSLEAEDVYYAECVKVIEEPTLDVPAKGNESLHVSFLTVQLKPSPDGKLVVEVTKPPRKSLQRKSQQSFETACSPSRPRPAPRRRRQADAAATEETELDGNPKRGNEALRSSLPLEAYGPPKKIRCTRSDRFTDKRFFHDESIERLFFCWMKEKNGVSFDITESTNLKKTIDIVHEQEILVEHEKSKNSTHNDTQKSAVDRLLEEALAKLEASANLSKELVAIEEKAVEHEKEKGGCSDDIAVLQQAMSEVSLKAEAPTPTPRTSLGSNRNSYKKKAPAPPAPPNTCEKPKAPLSISSGVSTTSTSKPSDVDSESGMSSMPKPSDDSQPEQAFDASVARDKKEDFVFVKPTKPSRKKKLRRALSWKKENCLIEKIQIQSTDSDSDYKAKNVKNLKNELAELQQQHQQQQQKHKEEVNRSREEMPPPLPPKPHKKHKNHIKKLFCKSSSQPCVVAAAAASEAALGSRCQNKSEKQKNDNPDEINRKLLHMINSPSKIKTAYTLTAMSSPSPYTESDYCETELPILNNYRPESRSCPSVLSAVQGSQEISQSTMYARSPRPQSVAEHQKQPSTLNQSARFSDSYIDQGFETGSNGVESPVRTLSRSSASAKSYKKASQQRDKSISPLFFKLRDSLESTFSRRSSFGLTALFSQHHDNPANFSTPVKGQAKRSNAFISSSGGAAGAAGSSRSPVFSPIPTPLKSRRRSLYEPDMRRNSSAMQVIREDGPLEQPPFTPDSINEDAFFANAPTIDMADQTADFDYGNERPSSFWVVAGDFKVSVNIFYNSPDRLRLLYEIFGQKRCEKKGDLHFGIDNHKFSVNNPADVEEISKRLPKEKGCSHYWFSTGDLAVPFNGKYMAPEKIKHFFDFVAAALEDNSRLRFGVDEFDFSTATEYFQSGPKFSLESSYSMLVGLQSGQSNGLEGRSKYAWPNSMCGSLNSNQIKTSDLDGSGFTSEDLSNGDMGRLSFSPFGSSPLDYSSAHSDATGSPRNSDFLRTSELFSSRECEPLDQLFAQRGCASPAEKFTIPEMLETLQEQKAKLKSVESNLRSYARQVHLTGDASEEFKDSPEYIRKIRKIIKSIDNIGQEDGFKACSIEQLESFMFVLSNYADNCLTSCSDHMDKILSALMEQRQHTHIQSTEI